MSHPVPGHDYSEPTKEGIGEALPVQDDEGVEMSDEEFAKFDPMHYDALGDEVYEEEE